LRILPLPSTRRAEEAEQGLEEERTVARSRNRGGRRA